MLLLGADRGFLGLLTIIGVAANTIQFLTPLFLERFTNRKKLLLWIRGIMLLINIGFIGAIPLFPVGQQTALTMTAVSVLTVNMLSALYAPGMTVWHLQSIPPNVRTGYFSLITMTAGAVTYSLNLLGSKLVDIFKANGAEYQGLLILRCVALALAAFDMYLLSKVKEYSYERVEKPPAFLDLFVRPFREKLYLRTVAVGVLWSFSANIPGTYFTVYLLEEVKTTYSYLTLINFLYVPVVLLLTPVWRKILGRFSWFKTLYIAMSMYLVQYLGLAFVARPTLWLYPVIAVFAYLMAVGINLSFSAIPYVNMPKQNQTMSIGFYSTAANLSALVGLTLGREFVLRMEGVRVSLFGMTLGNLQLLMLVTAVAMAVATLLIYLLQRNLPRPEN